MKGILMVIKEFKNCVVNDKEKPFGIKIKLKVGN